MKERPILFSTPMVRAILDGRKTQTRRIVKFNHSHRVELGKRQWHIGDPNCVSACPYGQPGDRLWVRETWRAGEDGDGAYVLYTSDNTKNYSPIELSCSWNDESLNWKWEEHDEHKQTIRKPSIFMPRWASRITLEITGVRVQRLQDISEADAVAEGIEQYCPFGLCKGVGYLSQINTAVEPDLCECSNMDIVECYSEFWKSINGACSWAANPWVWVIEFKRLEDK